MIGTVLCITMMLIVSIAKNDKKVILEEDECIVDYPFEWTDGLNQDLVDNEFWADFTIVQSSVGIDAVLISFLFIYWFRGTTFRIPGALIFFYPMRNVCQGVFLMGRLDGFLWRHPGI